jgi:Fe-S cluster assembly protein SufD
LRSRATGCRARQVAEARRRFEAYERTGLPHRRIEDWKYTDLRALMREVLPLAQRRMPRAEARGRRA